MRARRLVAVALLVAAAASAVWAFRPVEPGASGASSTAAVASYTPRVGGWSARRLPLDLADAVGAMRLPREVDRALSGTNGCFVLEAGGQPVLARNAEASLIPASTQKLLTGIAALAVLGADHRFTTEVVASGVDGASVHQLFVVGGGDPVLATGPFTSYLRDRPLTRHHPATSLERLADAVVSAGVRRVEAGVVGDASRHGGPAVLDTWKPGYLADHDITPLSALTVNWGLDAWDPAKVTSPDPAVSAASELARLLTERGVEVGGAAARGSAPAGAAELGAVRSPPLSEIVGAMVRESDNLIAEMLVREIGRARSGAGTTEAGTAALVAELAELGVPVDGVVVDDGSGLSRSNRATCAAMFAALDLADRADFAPVVDGLAVAGRSGTLVRRLLGTDLEGRLHAKTGSLDGVVALVGRYDRRPELSFAMLANGSFGYLRAVEIQEGVAAVLARYPFTVDASVLAPPPALRSR